MHRRVTHTLASLRNFQPLSGSIVRVCGLALLVVPLTQTHAQNPWRFVDVTQEAGVLTKHGYRDFFAGTVTRNVAGGAAAGDYDRDGWIDVYVECGDLGANVLYRNRGDGTFEDVSRWAGVALDSFVGSGPLFFDFDGDEWLDLFVGGIEGQKPVLFHNRGDGTFEDVTATSGIVVRENAVSATAADYDGDGRVDLFVSHWGSEVDDCYLWRNVGNGVFECADTDAGLSRLGTARDHTFTANFADLNNDRHVDLLLTVDFGMSAVWHNDGHGGFVARQSAFFSDENGMGSSVGDYDNDGDLDWFVSSIWDGDGVTEGDWGATGNRLYRNRGDGSFEDATDEAGVREGDWGWGSTFADLNNDGHLDLVQVNGWPRGSDQFHEDPSRIFVSDGQGSFVESAEALQFHDIEQGRGVVCFDYDRDGDLDILVANNRGPLRLWRNDGAHGNSYLTVKLLGSSATHTILGARIHIQVANTLQLRELRCGSNYVSQNPLEVHFGLGQATQVEVVQVFWPDGSVSTRFDVPGNQVLEIDRSQALQPGDAASSMIAFPNPFRGRTSITVEATDSSGGTVHVYDARGRLVRTLLPSFQRSHRVVFIWNGLDQSGRVLASGVYYLRDAVSTDRQTARIIRVR